jgi:hypothetical protein
MTKNMFRLLWVLVVLVAVLVPLHAWAAGREASIKAFGAEEGDDLLKVGVRDWFSTGQSEWQISFGETDPDFGYAGGRSILEWEDLEGDLPVLYGEVRITPWLSIGGTYASGDVEGGNTDTDRIDIEALELNDYLVSVSTADTEGEATLYDINAYVRLNPKSYFPNTIGKVDAVVGYQHYTEELRDRNGVQTVLFEEPMNEAFEGLDSTFDFTWDVMRLGVRGELPLLEWLRAKGEATALVGASYEGEGFWNLRDDYRATSPNFVQEADSGSGYDVRLALEVRPVPYVAIEAGYWWYSLEVEDGTETTYYADGSDSVENVDRAQSSRDGFFVGLSAQF